MKKNASELNKRYQQVWKKKQVGKQQIAVMISKSAHNILIMEKDRTGENFSAIVERAVDCLTKPSVTVTTELKRVEREMNKALTCIRDSLEKSLKEQEDIGLRLEKEMSTQRQTEESLRDIEKMFEDLINNSYDLVYRLNFKTGVEYLSPSLKRITGYSRGEWARMVLPKLKDSRFVEDYLKIVTHPDDYDLLINHHRELLKKGDGRLYRDEDRALEYRIKHRTRGYLWVSEVQTPLRDQKGKVYAIVGSMRDISKRKEAEMELQKLHDELEKKVEMRTTEIQESNTALKVLLKKMEKDRKDFEETILLNVKSLVLPALEKSKNTQRADVREKYMGILESNLRHITSPLSSKLTSKYFNLTYEEIEISNLIIQGKITKEIAEILHLSPKTVDYHRLKIRKKIGIANQKISLKSHLLSLVRGQ